MHHLHLPPTSPNIDRLVSGSFPNDSTQPTVSRALLLSLYPPITGLFLAYIYSIFSSSFVSSLSLSLYIVWPEFLARQVNRKHSCGYRFSLAIYDTYCNTCTFIHSSFSLHRLPSFFTCIHTYIFICIVLYIYIIHIYI